MTDSQPFHAHVYYDAAHRPLAEALQAYMRGMAVDTGTPTYVGTLRDRPIGPHPIAQFEIHFDAAHRDAMTAVIEPSGLRALVHPLTDDDLADHTRLAHWIGEPLELDLSVLDPPGRNKGVGRFGKSDV